MLGNIGKPIEVLSNVAIIFVAVLLIFILAKHYMAPTTRTAGRVNDVQLVGKKLSIADIDWAKNRRTLVFALQSDCRFCTESAPFYKEIVRQQSGATNLELVAVMPDSIENAKNYLSSLGVSIGNVKHTSFDSIGVSGTPTLLLVNNDGAIISAWKGRLNSNDEREVLQRIQQ